MADGGKFNASLELKLNNCGSLPGTSDTVTVDDLNGVSSFAKQIRIGAAGVCANVSNDCNHLPRLLILRPMSLQVKTWDETEGKWIVKDPKWLDVDSIGISRDQLAQLLSFKASDSTINVSLGRPQFYYDGLVNLLLGAPPTAPAAPKQLTFALQGNAFLDADGKLFFFPNDPVALPDVPKIFIKDGARVANSAGATEQPVAKYLNAVTVQLIAAYGD
jgi:hypothetical protein